MGILVGYAKLAESPSCRFVLLYVRLHVHLHSVNSIISSHLFALPSCPVSILQIKERLMTDIDTEGFKCLLRLSHSKIFLYLQYANPSRWSLGEAGRKRNGSELKQGLVHRLSAQRQFLQGITSTVLFAYTDLDIVVCPVQSIVSVKINLGKQCTHLTLQRHHSLGKSLALLRQIDCFSCRRIVRVSAKKSLMFDSAVNG
jgi:hypothetical protein